MNSKKDITNKNNWVNITDINKHSFKGNLFVKTPRTITEFYSINGTNHVNISNWSYEDQTHIVINLESAIIDNTKQYFVSQYKANLGYCEEMLQSNTFKTIKEVKEYIKTL